MNFLLDTHLLLWAIATPARLPRGLPRVLADPDNTLWFSTIAVWEVAIKLALERPDVADEPAKLLAVLRRDGYRELPVASEHALALLELPRLHRDPFDRMLIAQARVERLVLLTSDRRLAVYGPPVKVV